MFFLPLADLRLIHGYSDVSGREQIKNLQEQMRNTEVIVLTFVKDLLAIVALGGFSVASLTWMDFAVRLV
jgi:hypothetical protein